MQDRGRKGDLAQPLAWRIPQDPLDRRAHQAHPTRSIQDGDDVRRGTDHRLQGRLPFPQRHLGLSAVGDVADGGRDQQVPLRGPDRAQADLGGELAAILAPPGQPTQRLHRPGHRIGHIPRPLCWVAPLCPFGHQQLHRLAKQFLAGVAEQPLGLVVDQHDPPAGVHHDDRVGRAVDQLPDRRLGNGHGRAPQSLDAATQDVTTPGPHSPRPT